MRAAVAGGGVAGSASAIALARIGADVTVYEAYEDPAGPVGSFVSLAVNGLRALDALGCLTAGPAGRLPGRAPAHVVRPRQAARRGGPRPPPEDDLLSVTLMRADLVTALRTAALDAGARIVTGQRLTGRPTAARRMPT